MKTTLTLFLFSFLLILFSNCDNNKDDDCANVIGATFSSNGGRMLNIIQAKCGNSTCHGPGGTGSLHWQFSSDYAILSPHFEHMYEGAIEEGEMPPDTAIALTIEEINLFECWQAAGYPE